MKILYFSLGNNPHDDLFISALKKTDNEVNLYSQKGWAGKWLEWALPRSSALMESDIFLFPKEVHTIKTLVDIEAPDVIHAGPIHGPTFRAAMAGVHPLMALSWGSDLMREADRNLITRWITRFVLSRIDVLCGDSQCLEDVARKFGYKGPYFKFPWGIDLKAYNPDGAERYCEHFGWQENTVFLSVRSFEELYDVETIVRAFVIAVKKKEDLRLLVMGSGSRERLLRDIVKEGGALGKVHFGGKVNVDVMPTVFRSADVYVSATRSDGASVSLMEALATGLPALVSDIPGNREWIKPDVNGWLFTPGNVEELAEKMIAYDRNAAFVNEMKKRNRELAENRADWTKNFPVLIQAYEKAIELHKGKK